MTKPIDPESLLGRLVAPSSEAEAKRRRIQRARTAKDLAIGITSDASTERHILVQALNRLIDLEESAPDGQPRA